MDREEEEVAVREGIVLLVNGQRDREKANNNELVVGRHFEIVTQFSRQ